MAITLEAQLRTETGKGVARKLRAGGRIPGTVYGADKPTASVSVDGAELVRIELAAGLHSLIDLQVAGGEGDQGVQRVLIKELVRDPVRGDFVHVDFHAVALDQEMQTVVQIAIEGADARTDDGIVSVVLRELNIACLPTAIPESLPVDVSGLLIGDSLTVADVVAPEGVRLLNEPAETVVTIAAPRVEVDDAGDAEAAEDGEEAGAGAAAEAGGDEA